MKAYQVLMFLLIFNLMVWAVDAGLGIYDLDFSGINPPEEDYEEDVAAETGKESGDYSSHGLLATIGKTSITLIVGLLVAAAIIGTILGKEKAPQAIVYGAFTSVFWMSYLQAAGVIWAMISMTAGAYGALVIMIIISSMIAYVFIVGLFQMVTGGWKSYV